eukprot:scpid34575/ scgid33108/ Beta-mannosidase; Lysosomal beta A mannosidase; Mannanase
MYERRSGQRLLLLLAVLVCANAADLRDIPLAGDYASYLDGTWTAIGQTRGDFNGCNFEENIDYNHALSSGSTSSQAATSKEECCSLCSEMAGCASGVFHSSKCYFKTAQDLLSPSSQPGHVACTPHWLAGNTITLPNATVPGDLITDLEMAGKVGDPLYELNFKNATLWGFGAWNYTKTITFSDFDVQNIQTFAKWGTDILLVFDGIKMGAHIYLNGYPLGTAVDQFLRYKFSLGQAVYNKQLQVFQGNNSLVVSFDSTIDTAGRFMACTGGWDWAPYSTTAEASTGARTFTRGIWKSVYLLSIDFGSVAIEHIVPEIFYTGPYPTEPLAAHKHGDFIVNVTVVFHVPQDSGGVLNIYTEWGAFAELQVFLYAGTSVKRTLTLRASAKNISLWWPAGLGNQSLYTITAYYEPSGAGTIAVKSTRQIGFRYVALVTGNDTDAGYVKNASTSQTTGQQGMFFRVNGAAVFNRGANMIPMEELEGRMNAVAFSRLVQSAVDGRMNMLRVWGGGIFLPDIWYDECDRLGIMVYHDMQYAQNGHSPSNNPVQDAELRHQIRRLSHHPCIVVWDGCNECRVKMGTATGIYATFVMTVVMQEDKSRPIWPSCPAIGWTAGVHALDATPTGDVLTTPNDARSIETHGPYQHGGGFPSVNGDNRLVLFPSNIPIKVSQIDTGVALQNVFASEFGCSVFSSFESMSPTLHPSHWGVHAGLPPDNCTGGFHSRCSGNNPMAERNYACDNIIQVYFGENDKLDSVGEAIFKQQLYHCILGQALVIKSNIETRRSTNQFGIVVWQYNEIWPTGGWGSIEYGTPRPGQVIGGRWKPLHYFYRQSIFTDVTVACGGDGLCYVKNDIAKAFSGTVVISAIAFANAQVTTLESKTLSLATGPGVTEWIQVDFSKINPADQVITATIMNADKEVVCDNVIPLTEPYKMKLLKANVKVSVGSKNPGGSVDIHLTTDHVAMYVTVTTLAAGRFSDNALLLLPAGKTVQFLPFSDTVDMSLLQSSIRVEDVSLYM